LEKCEGEKKRREREKMGRLFKCLKAGASASQNVRPRQGERPKGQWFMVWCFVSRCGDIPPWFPGTPGVEPSLSCADEDEGEADDEADE
jgi:hypothetical protein